MSHRAEKSHCQVQNLPYNVETITTFPSNFYDLNGQQQQEQKLVSVRFLI